MYSLNEHYTGSSPNTILHCRFKWPLSIIKLLLFDSQLLRLVNYLANNEEVVWCIDYTIKRNDL